MNPIHRRPDRYGVVMTLVIVLTVWTVNSLGLLRYADDCLSDLANAFAARSYAPDDSLLVYVPPSVLDNDDQLLNLVSRIGQDGPAKIAIVHPVSHSQAKRLDQLPFAEDIVVGYQRASNPSSQNNAATESITCGYLDLCLKGQSVYRNHLFKHQSVVKGSRGIKTEWSIEAQIARQVLGERNAGLIPGRPVGVRFFGGASGLANVSSDDVLYDAVIPEMVAGRIVMIGPQSTNEQGFVTPTTLGADRMSRLELHANFLQTLLHDNYLVSLSELGILGVIFCVPMVCVHCFRNLANRWMIRSWLAFQLMVCLLGWTCLSLWSVRMPVTAMLAAVALSFVSVLYLRFRALKDLVDNWRLLRSTNERITLQRIDNDRWKAMADSLVEVFAPRRAVLMRLDPGSTHLEVSQTCGCGVDAIREQRRDVHRYPFREAIDQNYPTQIEDRRFLVEPENGGVGEFMVPLVMLSEVIGFMVVEMDDADLERWSDFESCLARYAGDMAIFLAGDQDCDEAGEITDRSNQPSRTLPEQAMAAALIKDEVQHRGFQKMLGRAVDGAETAIAIGDVFGQLVKVNEKMVALMQRGDVSAQDTSCVEVLARLTHRDEDECRQLFRRCIIEDRSEQIVLASKSAADSSSVLFVRPLSASNQDHQRGIDSRFVAIEIVSGEIFDAINHWQRQFMAAQSDRIDRQMELLLQIAGDLEIVKRDGGSQTDPYVAMARDVLRSVNECRAATGNNLTDTPTDHFLLDTKPVLSAALRSGEDDMRQSGVTVSEKITDEQVVASANPFLLEQVFSTIVECLVSDCDEETQLIIECDRAADSVIYRFSTQSTLLETTQLERCLFGTSESERAMLAPCEDALLTQRHLDRLRESNRWLAAWGAKLSIDCDAFYRVSISLELMASDQAVSNPSSDFSAEPKAVHSH
ncbi:CHASE2 domain-containing protein [Stieleria marina]